MRALVLPFMAASLVGCSGIPSVPYEQPAESENTARIRVITNSTVFGDSITSSCAPSTRHKMAEAGRLRNVNYPQYPQTPVNLGMPKRLSPKMAEYIPAIRMGEGPYTEVATEYRVRTDVPLQLSTLGATIGSYGNLYYSCSEQALVFKLEPGKSYEAYVGVAGSLNDEGTEELSCVFGMIELLHLPGSEVVLPMRMMPSPAPEVICKD